MAQGKGCFGFGGHDRMKSRFGQGVFPGAGGGICLGWADAAGRTVRRTPLRGLFHDRLGIAEMASFFRHPAATAADVLHDDRLVPAAVAGAGILGAGEGTGRSRVTRAAEMARSIGGGAAGCAYVMHGLPPRGCWKRKVLYTYSGDELEQVKVEKNFVPAVALREWHRGNARIHKKSCYQWTGALVQPGCIADDGFQVIRPQADLVS